MNLPMAEAVETQPSTACPACSHALEAHDPLGDRYCTATVAGGFDRGCICSRETRLTKA
ncbi:RGCVC family protein [Amycolatopsis lurida]